MQKITVTKIRAKRQPEEMEIWVRGEHYDGDQSLGIASEFIGKDGQPHAYSLFNLSLEDVPAFISQVNAAVKQAQSMEDTCPETKRRKVKTNPFESLPTEKPTEINGKWLFRYASGDIAEHNGKDWVVVRKAKPVTSPPLPPTPPASGLVDELAAMQNSQQRMAPRPPAKRGKRA